MTASVVFRDGSIEVDASILADAMDVEPATVPDLIRDGILTSRCEQGIDADAGRYRLTFFGRNRRLRLIVDDAGQVLRKSLIDFGDRLLPASLRHPG